MITHRTYCALRLGDNLAHLHLLRGLAITYPAHRFLHYAHLTYVHQLSEVVCDLPNLQVLDLESVDDGTGDHWTMRPNIDGAINAWKNAGGFWESHVLKDSWAEFQLVLCDRLARRMGLASPYHSKEELLFNYPALKRYQFPAFDCLVINSTPMSGQLPTFNPAAMELLIGELAQRMAVITTAPNRLGLPCTMNKQMTVSQIGALSRFCRYIIGVATGPSWPTWNVFNAGTVEFRLVMLANEHVNLTPHTAHVQTADEARRVLQVRGIL